MTYTCNVCGLKEEGYTPMDPPGFWALFEGICCLCPRCASQFRSEARALIAQMKLLPRHEEADPS